MPREIVHWHILDRAMASIGPASQVSGAALHHSSLTYLGAMSPDALYYHSYGKNLISTAIGERIHGGGGENTFLLVNAMIQQLRREPTYSVEAMASFIAGYLSHCAVDSVFHPWIFYLTGDYYHPDPMERRSARTRHRLFETYLDSWFRIHRGCKLSERLEDHLLSVGDTIRQVESLIGKASEVFADSEITVESIDGEKRWHSAIYEMTLQQGRFLSDTWGLAMSVVNCLSFHHLDPIDALCSYRRRHDVSYFSEELLFLNPVSGAEKCAPLDSLIEEAVKRTLDYWSTLELCLTAGDRVFDAPGPSLNFGIVGAHHAKASFYASQFFPPFPSGSKK